MKNKKRFYAIIRKVPVHRSKINFKRTLHCKLSNKKKHPQDIIIPIKHEAQKEKHTSSKGKANNKEKKNKKYITYFVKAGTQNVDT